MTAQESIPITHDINSQLTKLGAAIIEELEYSLDDQERSRLQSYFRQLPRDTYGTGERQRAYLRLDLDLQSGRTDRASDQAYSQTYEANDMNGNETRNFAVIPREVFEDGPLGVIIRRQIELLTDIYCFVKPSVQLGVHTVRYVARKGVPTYSSPIMFHRDDEPVVLLTVVDKSENLVGGDTLLARSKKVIDRSVCLEPFQTALLSKATLHMVTPMESTSSSEPAWRDIILLTVEEPDHVLSRRVISH